MFSRVIYDDTIHGDIARVNRQTGDLYINPDIWDRISGLEKDYVLLHEAGHLELMTASEYQAHRYAVERFCQVQTLTDNELGRRIVVMSEITDPTRYMSGSGGVDPVSAVANAIGSVFEALPMLGVGKKSRLEETEANKKAALELSESNTSGIVKIVAIAGVIVIVVVVLIFIFKK